LRELLPIGDAHTEIHTPRRTLRRQMPGVFQQQVTGKRADQKERKALFFQNACDLLKRRCDFKRQFPRQVERGCCS
jgi:hypothetical protein